VGVTYRPMLFAARGGGTRRRHMRAGEAAWLCRRRSRDLVLKIGDAFRSDEPFGDSRGTWDETL
jgi:hypothetical protein